MSEDQTILSENESTPYHDWTVVFKSGAVIVLEQVALVRHTTSGTLTKLVVTRNIPLGAEVAVDNQGNYQLDLDEISGLFRASP